MRGTCEQCKRNDVYIKAIGLCSVCYHLWQGQKDCIVCGQLSWIYARKMCNFIKLFLIKLVKHNVYGS